MLYRWCFSCGHRSAEALWLEFRKITFYHYNLSISSEIAVHLRNKCCFSKLSSYCSFTHAVIRIHRCFSRKIVHLVIHFSWISVGMTVKKKEKKERRRKNRESKNAIESKIKLHILYSYFSYKLLFSKENLDYWFVSATHEMQDFAYIWVLSPHIHSAVTFSEAIGLSSEIRHVAIYRWELKPSDREERNPGECCYHEFPELPLWTALRSTTAGLVQCESH